jgi:hypothetical protein
MMGRTPRSAQAPCHVYAVTHVFGCVRVVQDMLSMRVWEEIGHQRGHRGAATVANCIVFVHGCGLVGSFGGMHPGLGAGHAS